ncbi:hypothetical protein [Methyloradius palustris]|uniref:Uncharacterized protein n=1 Tax=Methyloradius palustris TaxID=2778876 RepID=A0A8D5GDB7_9PROT|nr:hypothetical protein [Methyloradius palustris]BCM24519.1 hypothetical protein ZMTM_07780 [Methyloradius palustris]
MQTQSEQNSPASLILIVREVRTEGFCVVYCNSLVRDVLSEDELVRRIYQLASSVGLKVSFNAEKTLCIFEQY